MDISELTYCAENEINGVLMLLGYLYEHGYGVKKNLSEAATCYVQAAKKGNPVAQYCVALMYEKGDGVGKDAEEAFKWCKESFRTAIKFCSNHKQPISATLKKRTWGFFWNWRVCTGKNWLK